MTPQIAGDFPVRKDLTKDQYVHFLWLLIGDIEQHEQKEWFRVGGNFYVHPHPPGVIQFPAVVRKDFDWSKVDGPS